MEKTSKLYAIIHSKCPHCRRGDIFTGNVYGFNIQRTNEVCSHCNQRFEIEPGYFYAAMYLSYALSVLETITLGIATYVFSGGRLEFESLWLYSLVIILGSLILSPFNYRYSRVLLLHMLSPKIKYEAKFDTP
jgi:uncharacterized protein (DUF983 family)